MKVYYVLNNLDGCWYARCVLPLRVNGFRADKESFYGDISRQEQSAINAMNSDVVVFQRPDEMQKVKAMKMLKKMGKKIVFENDDTYKFDDAMKFGKKWKEKDRALDEGIKIADLVTTSTEYLANEYRKLNKNVVVLPNCVDQWDWDKPLRNEGEKVRIGFVGSVTANGDYDGITLALKELSKRKDVQIVVFGMAKKCKETDLYQKLYQAEYNFWESLNIEWQPLVFIERYFETLNNLKLDIMCIPRKNNYFNHCKSNIKFLEASMLEIPVIAQGFPDGLSPYEADPEDARHQIIIKDNKDWLNEINKLIINKNLRRTMGANVKKYVIDKYDINIVGKKWGEIFAKLYNGDMGK